jgi:penicillin amidase
VLVTSACNRPSTPPRRADAPLPQVDGSLSVGGLREPVTVVRDRWGIPHITARNEHDLFFAQGFVQAQDRLFQMDLWRRTVQGRLAQVLGSNFIDRDVMTARLQYHGSLDAEWASYAPGTQGISEAFVAGVNAWVVRARTQLPVEFALAGWIPELWTPIDLLNRTDAFLASGDADLQALRAQLIAEAGLRRADELLPAVAGRAPWAVTDLAAAGRAVAEAIRRAGTAPYFAGFATSFAGSNAWAIPASRSATGAPLLASDPHRPLTSPALRYLIHLKAPGWNVIGATSPWLPGIAIGHNEHVAWGTAAYPVSTEDVRVEVLRDAVVVADAIPVKRSKPFAFDREYTPHGVVIASDREHQLVFTLGWAGFDAGAAPELGALALDRARSIAELSEAVKGWKMPVVDVVYADASTVGHQVSGRYGHGSSASASVPIAANESLARTSRLAQMLAGSSKYTIDDMKRQQHDVTSWNAGQLVPRLAALRAADPVGEAARQELVGWDRRITGDSVAGALYIRWERALWRRMTEAKVPAPLVDAYLARVPFDVRQALKAPAGDLLAALVTAAGEATESDVIFRNPLGITQAARRRFDVGPFRPGGDADTVLSLSRRSNADIGPSFRQIVDLGDWDRSVATSAPGQSQWTRSPHFADLAKLWGTGEYFPLSFSDRAIQQNAESTLVLQPMK